jgi:hypothetical protein
MVNKNSSPKINQYICGKTFAAETSLAEAMGDGKMEN